MGESGGGNQNGIAAARCDQLSVIGEVPDVGIRFQFRMAAANGCYHAISYLLLLNVGDMLHRWSNGQLRSTPHRVINRSGRERYSCPFFYDPNVAAEIAPLASCIEPGNPPRFAPQVFGDFLRAELEAGYQKHAKGR